MITQEYLKVLLTYDLTSGLFTWNFSKSNVVKKGEIAGSITGYGYREIMIDGKSYPASKLAVLYVTGIYPSKVDHINTVTTDDSYSNLRLADKYQNNWNRSISSANTTGIKGLSWNKQNRWCCKLTCKGKTMVRYFKTNEKDIAIKWLQETRQSLHGEFTNHG